MENTETTQVWCNTCQTWHNIADDQDAAQFENWGCALDMKKTRKVKKGIKIMKKINTIDVIVTRHPGLVEYLKKEKLISNDVKVVSHASPELVRGKHVLGVLPHSLSCLTASFTEIPLRLPAELRGKELTVEDVRQYAGAPITYKVRKL